MLVVSERYAKLIREGYDAWNAGDRSCVLEHLSPDVVWVTPPDDPDQGVYRGHDAVIGFWDQWQAAVGQLEFEIEELIEARPHVLAVAKRSGTGAHIGPRGLGRGLPGLLLRRDDLRAWSTSSTTARRPMRAAGTAQAREPS